MTETWLIVLFAVLIPAMLVLDLGVFNKRSHKVSNKEAAIWTGVWVGLAMLFGVVVYFTLGGIKATQFYTAFIIEKALSVDNLFVFILVFSYFRVPEEYHHKVLFWGIIGAIVLRFVFIFTGATLIEMTYIHDINLFNWHIEKVNVILMFFGFFLVYAGLKSFGHDEDEEPDFSRNLGLRFVKWLFPVVDKYDGGKFFTKIPVYASPMNGVRYRKMATLLLVVVGVIEVTDVIFAVDSIPAIFTVSQDPFILYSSNIFAILGLRTLYFLLNNFINYFAYLNYGLGLVLSFIGLKMILAPVFHISSPVSLIVVGSILLIATVASIIFAKTSTAVE